MSDPVLPPVPGTEHGAYADPAKVSPKVVASAVAGFVAPAILLGLLFLQTDDGQVYFGGLPKILVVIIGGLLASAVTFVSGYIKRDPARNG
jgi:hypothetical protein